MEEDDALIQVMNHGSSIHHAGFLTDTDIFALSHDEVMSIYQLADPDEEVKEPLPQLFGDLRERLGCEYVVQVIESASSEVVLATGSHRLVYHPQVLGLADTR